MEKIFGIDTGGAGHGWRRERTAVPASRMTDRECIFS